MLCTTGGHGSELHPLNDDGTIGCSGKQDSNDPEASKGIPRVLLCFAQKIGARDCDQQAAQRLCRLIEESIKVKVKNRKSEQILQCSGAEWFDQCASLQQARGDACVILLSGHFVESYLC